MSDLQQFKCPACGGTITYNGTSNKLKCNYCGTEFDLDALSQYNQNLNQSIEREDLNLRIPILFGQKMLMMFIITFVTLVVEKSSLMIQLQQQNALTVIRLLY